ncbi:flagellar hook-associated protein 2 [Virgibacillus sp. JSM 102003]|uniref:flagellar hook-associated protein 2 n=1 Tax=Virgibacillus sp. JSM 102003 TaxID=1562108 RepID=UPI0035BEC267
MRIGGLATGMDIDKLVNKLMKAERMPLNRMQQESTTLTWKRDAFRDINKKLLELDDMMLNMKYSSTYNAKSVSSSNESAVTAAASSDATNGTYNISVSNLATSATNISSSGVGIDPNTALKDTSYAEGFGTKSFKTYNEDGSTTTHKFDVNENDTLNDVLERISDADNNVRAFYDSNTKKVIVEATRAGNYNDDGDTTNGAEPEIDFTGNTFFTTTLNMDMANEKGGEDAKFNYNGIEMTSHNNSYELGGVTYQFKSEGSASLTVSNDVESSFDKITKFVEKYNEVVEKLNGSQQEEIYRDYKPLTDKQKEGMSEDEIELWEEKAKSGILRGESAISDGLFSMRRSWYSNVDTGGEITSLTQVGITTSSNYRDGGKLTIDPVELKAALKEDPAGVQKLFSNSNEDGSRGLINRLDDALDSTRGKIEARAGSGFDTLENYSLGKRMKDLNTRISDFEDRLVRVENRYWSQFTQMEKAIQRMNQQSAQLMSQFGGGA